MAVQKANLKGSTAYAKRGAPFICFRKKRKKNFFIVITGPVIAVRKFKSGYL